MIPENAAQIPPSLLEKIGDFAINEDSGWLDETEVEDKSDIELDKIITRLQSTKQRLSGVGTKIHQAIASIDAEKAPTTFEDIVPTQIAEPTTL